MVEGTEEFMDVLRVKKLSNDAHIPSYQTRGSAGMDLHASESMILPAMSTRLIPTGLAMEIPEGFEGQIRPRSGLALKHHITVLNSPGTIDSDYRGEIKIILSNLSGTDFEIKKGERIAQIVFAPVARLAVREVASLDETERGGGGFGSTGT